MSSTRGLQPRASSPSAATTAAAVPVVIDDVEDLLTAASDEHDKLWFWRRGEDWVFLESRSPVSLRVLGIRATVQDRFGGGRFRARLRSRGGKWGVSREFSIEGEAKTPPREEAPATTAAAPIGTSSAGETPDWVRQIVLPIATTLGAALAAALAKKMLDTPGIDPTIAKILELSRQSGNGKSVDPLELQRLLLEAEHRGEERGREMGELSAQVESRGGGASNSGVAGAVSEAVPVLHRMLDMATGRGARRRSAPAALPAPSESSPSSSSTPTVPDIVPVWLRPFIGYKHALLGVADRGKAAVQYADLIMDSVEDDEQLLTAVVEANTAGRLLTDLKAAIPEIAGHQERERFAGELVAAIQESLRELTVPDDAPAPATPPKEEAARA